MTSKGVFRHLAHSYPAKIDRDTRQTRSAKYSVPYKYRKQGAHRRRHPADTETRKSDFRPLAAGPARRGSDNRPPAETAQKVKLIWPTDVHRICMTVRLRPHFRHSRRGFLACGTEVGEREQSWMVLSSCSRLHALHCFIRAPEQQSERLQQRQCLCRRPTLTKRRNKTKPRNTEGVGCMKRTYTSLHFT